LEDDSRHLLERDGELGTIDALIGRVASGQGALLVIEGAAGIGKTQLLAAARERARAAGLRVLHARGGVLDAGHSYGVTQALLGPLVAERAAGPGQSVADVTGPAAPLFDQQATLKREPPDEPSFAVLGALCEIVFSAARRGPLLVCVDDAHWADPETLRFLTSLASRLHDQPLLLALGARMREPGAARELLALLAGDPAAVVIRPEPLSAQALAIQLNEALGAEPDPEFTAAFARATGGNPFLAGELVRTLVAENLPPSASTAGRVSAFAPPGVSRAVLARLARLSEPARRVSAALAVLSGSVDWNVLARLSELDHEQLAVALDALVDADVVVDALTPEFRHAMLRSAVYDDLPASDRDRLHRRAAELLAAAPAAHEEVVATHLLLSRPRAEPWAAQRLMEAAERALAVHAADAACRYLHRAVEEPPAGDQLPAVLALLGEAESRRGHPAEAAQALRGALETHADPLARGEIAVKLSLALVRCDRAPEATAVLERALDEIGDDQLELGRKIESELEVIAHLNARAGRSVADRPRRFPRPDQGAPSDHGERLALAGRADLEMNQGRADEAARLASLALDGGELLRDESAGAVLFFSTAIVLLYCDHLDEAERTYVEALGYARELGLSGMVTAAEGFLAGVAYRRGDLHTAETHARAGLQGLKLGDGPMRTVFPGAFLINALLERGELGLAERALDQLDAGGALPDALITNVLQHARGRLRAARGDHEGALADHLRCGHRAGEWEMHTPAVENWRSLAAIELAALGRAEEARQHAAEGTAAARSFGSARALGMALTAEGTISGSLKLLDQAVTVLASSPARLAHAQALVALGAGLRRAGQRAAGRETLTRGLRLARTCGAVPLGREADSELSLLGSRTRRVIRSGTEELTAAERRVAALAADGYSNQQIADALVVSIRTVEAHLAHVYQKLNIKSRRQLAAALSGGAPASAPTR
jgi:DNA-binding CsgD family transcriptional regulator